MRTPSSMNGFMRTLLALAVALPAVGAAACASAGGGGGAPANAFVGAWASERMGYSRDTLYVYAGGRAELRSPYGNVPLTYELPAPTQIRLRGYERGGVGTATLGEDGASLPLSIARADGSNGYFPFRRVK